MAVIPGSVPVTGFIAPTDSTDTYATHDAIYGRGGLVAVANAASRTAITADRRSEGMWVLQIDTGVLYQLQVDLVTWTALPFASLPSDVMLQSDYDTTATGNSVDNALNLNGQLPAYYLARANHTGTQAQSTITNLVADLAAKEDDSNKGATNGYCPLVGGTVPLANLPFIGTQYLGLYDASTNTPAILNGVGTAGDFYIANVTGNAYAPVNVTVVNQIVAYDGATWQVGGVAAASVTSVNALTGAVVLTTANVADSAGKRYVVEAVKDGLVTTQAGAYPASTTNPIVTQDELDAAIASVTVGLEWNSPESFADGQTLGDGTARSILSLGYATVGAAQAAFPLATPVIQVAGDLNKTIDYIASYCAIINTQGTSGMSEVHWGLYGKREYVINDELPLFLPTASSKLSDIAIYDFHGQTITQNTAAKCVFKSIPANQVTADNLIERALRFKNGLFRRTAGAKGDGGYTFSIGAMKRGRFENIDCQAFDKDYNLIFCLATAFVDCNSNSPETTGYNLKSADGEWTGGTWSNSQCNGSYFINCRHTATATGDYGWHLQDSSDIWMLGTTAEGADGSLKAIFFDCNVANTVVKGFSIKDIHIEAGYDTCAIEISGREGIFDISNIYNQKQGLLAGSQRILVQLTSLIGSMEARINNNYNAPTYQQWGANSAGYCKFDFDHAGMPGNPQTAAAAQAIAALWSDQVPNTIRLTPAL